MNDDWKELLALLKSHEVEFLVIGAHALAFYSRPRMTQDIDLLVGNDLANAKRLASALEAFGASIGEEGARRFAEQDRQMIRLGVPPNMIDILNFSSGTEFKDLWNRREKGMLDGVELWFPSKADLIDMKKAANRKQDLADIERLGG